jgi:protein ImuB
MRRVVSVWLPRLTTDRLTKDRPDGRDSPLAAAAGGGVRRLVAVDRAAQAGGLKVGMTVAEALAVCPGVELAPADPAADRALLDRLADWCGRYTPWAAADAWVEGIPGGGLWLDVSGCTHLFGGEAGLLSDLCGRLERGGLAARAAVADTPGAAWAWARFGGVRQSDCLPPGGQRNALAPLPVAALRLAPFTAATLAGLGLRRIGELTGVPRAGLAARFGREVAHRLDQALGAEAEPISPRKAPAPHRLQMAFAEPIGRTEDVEEATRRLLARLCQRLDGEGQGVRRLELAAFRVDNSVRDLTVGTGRPVRDPRHLMRLLAEPLAALDAGFGIEMLRLSAAELGPLEAEQGALAAGSGKGGTEDVARLLDSLRNRLGRDRVVRFDVRQSHLPERAVRRLAAGEAPAPAAWPAARRPLRLLAPPEPVEAVAPVPDSPPVMFRWRRRTHRVARADPAERIACEWWRAEAPERDYYLVEDEQGRRFWLFRRGLYGSEPPPRGFLHGIFP